MPTLKDLPRWRSHKIVQAAPITHIDDADDGYRLRLAWEAEGGISELTADVEKSFFARKMAQPFDVFVVYDDGYQSWSPRSEFEKGYHPLGADNFGWALERLNRGERVCRDGWNGKGMFLFLVAGSRFTVNRPPLLGIYPPGTEVGYHPHIDMRTAQGYIVPWVASQTDLLATDWMVVAD